jgi:hypothetical protein
MLNTVSVMCDTVSQPHKHYCLPVLGVLIQILRANTEWTLINSNILTSEISAHTQYSAIPLVLNFLNMQQTAATPAIQFKCTTELHVFVPPNQK